jgi:CubicO group peptidase (beta-lactamase class C family)
MAKVVTLINAFGHMAGWNSATMNILGRDVEGISEMSYDDTVEKEVIKGAGMFGIGVGVGDYNAKFGLKLYQEEVIAIMDVLPPGIRIQEIMPFDVIIQYTYKTRIYKDIIRNVEFTKVGKAVKKGDKTVEQTLECICTHIDWNV